MTSRRLHLRGRPNHPEDDPRPLKVMRARTLISSRALARGVSGPWMPRRSGGIIEDARFFHQQANWCYQLAWQCFDLAVAHESQPNGQRAYGEGARASAGTEGTADAEARRS